MTAPLGVILAGGLASRMGGGDKSLLKLDERPILQHVIDRLTPQVAKVAINANGDPERFAAYGLPVIADSIAEYPGPLAGVLAGLDWAYEQGASAIVTAAADTPFFPNDLVHGLVQAASGMKQPLALAASKDADGKQWRQPTFGLWPVSLRDDLRGALQAGMRKVVMWTDQHDAREAVFDSAEFDPFFNVNRPEDLVKARALLEQVT